MKSKLLLTALFLLFAVCSHCQIMFEKHYGGDEDIYGWDCLQTQDKGYLVCGGIKLGDNPDIYI